MSLRWRRTLAILLGVLVFYALAGVWGVPWLLRSQLPKLAASQLERQAAVEAVRFNPFTLRLQARGLKLAEADGAPLLSIDELRLRLQWRSLLRRAWSLEEVHIGAPSLQVVVAPDGQLNYGRLVDDLQGKSGPPREDGRLPRLLIERLTLSQGRIGLDDRQAGHTAVLSPVTFDVERFSTLPEDRDSHLFTAESADGGRLRWQGEASLDPVRASGQVTLENLDLTAYAPYLKAFSRIVPGNGRLAATLPYRVSYVDGQLEARLNGASLAVDKLALAQEGDREPFTALDSVRVEGIDADLVGREVAIAAVRLTGGHLQARRDRAGRLDLAQLLSPAATVAAAPAATPAAAPAATAPSAAAGEAATTAAAPWRLSIAEVKMAQFAVRATDETVQPPVTLAVRQAGLQFRLQAAQAAQSLDLTLADAVLALDDLALSQAQRSPLRLARLNLSGGQFDLARRRLDIARVSAEDGALELSRDAQGRIDLLALLPGAGPADAAAAAHDAGPAWSARVRRVELAKLAVQAADQSTGIRLRLLDVAAGLDGVGTDLRQPVAFQAGLRLAEGGQLELRGSATPASGSLEAQVQARQLPLRVLQPLLAQHVRLHIAAGALSSQGRLKVGAAAGRAAPPMRYDGRFEIAGLLLKEDDGTPFLGWKSVAADRFSVAASPHRLEIPELRIVEPKAILIVEADRSFNAARLLVRQPGAAAAAPASAPDAFPVRIPRVRLQNADVLFEDRSLRPQFGAQVQELNGVVTGLSTRRDGRSQVELDGRVGEFGLARVRGGLNPFVPRDNTDLAVTFRNVDLVPVSPYAMKFAGYRIAGGRISLDLRYRVRDGKLEGTNQIIMDQLTLGERVDSPDALKLPLELAIAILKDSDGRIDLGLPVSGDTNDPQFSYSAIIWKAIGNLITRIVTAPFRALGAMFGVTGDKLESIDFDAGSSRLLPPEREKLKQVAAILAKREQLALTVPGHYHEAGDGAALRAQAVRADIARRAGIQLAPGEAPGPLDLADGAIRRALRELFAARFGDAALDQARKAAEAAPAAAPEASGGAGAPPAAGSVPAWQRVRNFVQGEPQVADSRPFYRDLRQRLEQAQALPPDGLARLGTERAQAVAAALAEAGADPARITVGPPAAVADAPPRQVPLKLDLVLKR